MKATGVIRRIDDLGRIVIPKEIRKNLRIKNGENLEIFLSENENIILRKHNQIDKLKDLAQTMSDAINNETKKDTLITNTDEYIAITGSLKRKYLGKPLSNQIQNYVTNRQSALELTPITITLADDKTEELSYAISPIIAGGDIIGTIILASKEEITEDEAQIIKVVANFFSRYIEQ